MVGGRIQVQNLVTGQVFEAANAHDYIYPSDVRINAQRDLLFVKASGLAGGIWQQTWLFEYDLRNQKTVTRLKVADAVLPEECPATMQVK